MGQYTTAITTAMGQYTAAITTQMGHHTTIIMILLFIIMFSSGFVVSQMLYITRMIPISPDEFQRLLAREPRAVVFWRMSVWEGRLYISCVNGTQICTKSKQPLEFPETCELILIK
jgi:hypothetical protein